MTEMYSSLKDAPVLAKMEEHCAGAMTGDPAWRWCTLQEVSGDGRVLSTQTQGYG